MAEINNSDWHKQQLWRQHKSILKKSVARAVCLCSPQLQLGQLNGWWLESFESLFSHVSGCWCPLLVGTLAGADSGNTYTWTPGSHCGPSLPTTRGWFQGSDAQRHNQQELCCPLWKSLRNLFQHILFIRSKSLMLTHILLFLCKEYVKIYGHI